MRTQFKSALFFTHKTFYLFHCFDIVHIIALRTPGHLVLSSVNFYQRMFLELGIKFQKGSKESMNSQKNHADAVLNKQKLAS